MLAEALREGLVHLVGSVVLSEDRMIAVLRETLRRYGIEEGEIEKAVEEARANLSRWRGTAAPGPSLGDLASSGLASLFGALGIPTKADFEALAERIEKEVRGGREEARKARAPAVPAAASTPARAKAAKREEKAG